MAGFFRDFLKKFGYNFENAPASGREISDFHLQSGAAAGRDEVVSSKGDMNIRHDHLLPPRDTHSEEYFASLPTSLSPPIAHNRLRDGLHSTRGDGLGL